MTNNEQSDKIPGRQIHATKINKNASKELNQLSSDMNNLNPFILATLILAFLSVSCEKEELPWVTNGILTYEVSNSNINKNCTSLFFQSKTIGYATTQDGEIFKTNDGGKNWYQLNISSPVPLRTLYFITKDIGYVFGGKENCSPSPCEPFGSIAYKTTNGGRTWQRQNIPNVWSKLNSAYFFNENNGMAVGLGLCIKTTDGGKTWQQFTMNNKTVVSKISFANQETGYALNLGGLYKTNDGGESWRDIGIDNNKMTFDFYFINEKLGYANDLNEILKTIDGGESWSLIDSLENPVNFIHFANEKNGVTLSKRYLSSNWNFDGPPWKHVVRYTNNGGQTWITLEYEEEELNERCLFAKDNVVYSLGYNKIYKLRIE